MEKSVALIGVGHWGKNLARVFDELGVLKVICDTNTEVLGQYPASDYKDILNDPEIKAVAIATPPASHYQLAKEALLSNKDVFVEKPLVLNIKEGEELIKIAKKRNLVLMVGHLFHYHPAVVKLKEMINNGELGDIRYIWSNRLNFGKLRQEENVLWSFAPHDISLIIDLLGMPEKISSQGKAYLRKNIFDTTLSILNFKDNKTAHIFVSWLNPFKEQKFSVIGSKKMAVFDGVKNELMIYPHQVKYQFEAIEAIKAEGEIIEVPNKEPLMEEMKHFLDCIEQRKNPKTDGHEALRVLKILDSCQKLLENSNNSNFWVHHTAEIQPGARIGDKTKIWNNCQILSSAEIGENCIIGHNCFISSKLGNNVKVESNVDIWDLVVLEDDVFVGPSAVFTNDLFPRAKYPKSKYPQYGKWLPTLIKQGATIGANATIVCNNTIGKYAVVGAGAVVTKDVPNYALVVGVPAKVVGWVCQCGNKLEFANDQAQCQFCQREYIKKDYEVSRSN